MPPVFDDSLHERRCLEQLRSKEKDLEKYIFLSGLKQQDPTMFYRLCVKHMAEITPLIYTPTVGDACQQWSHIWQRPEGLASC
jgi:malate dehydrogenase (oxaloacetate-decarboxylating)(NADP+)